MNEKRIALIGLVVSLALWLTDPASAAGSGDKGGEAGFSCSSCSTSDLENLSIVQRSRILDRLGKASPLISDVVTKLVASDATTDDQFGTAISVDGDTMVVSAWHNDDAGSDSGSVYIYERNVGGPDNWGEVIKITAPDAALGDEFGSSVSISNDTIVVGAYLDDDAGTDSGAAYVFERNVGGMNNWGELRKLVASDASAFDEFGVSVSISEDTIVVGAWQDDDAGPASGSAYIFARNFGGEDIWGEVAKLTAFDAASLDEFGLSVSLNGDTAVVGAWQDSHAGIVSGSAYVFERNTGGADSWGQVDKLVASDASHGDQFGSAVSLGDGTVVVGARGKDETGVDSGAAYVFEKNLGGTAGWGEVTKLTATDGGAGDEFGIDVSLSGDIIVVGAIFNDDAGTSSGSAYSFQRNIGGADGWGELEKIVASDGAAGDLFGIVSISGDTVVVSAAFDDDAGSASGSAYVFVASNLVWQEDRETFASDGEVYDDFGWSVSISENMMVVGARFEDADAGAAYVFERNAGGLDSWGEVRRLVASDRESGDRFGVSVGISGDIVVVGAYLDHDQDLYSGSIYVFGRNAGGLDNWGQVKKITASDAGAGDFFGFSVDINVDTIVVGAIYGGSVLGFHAEAGRDQFNEPDPGAAYVFERNSGGVDNWGEVRKIIASDSYVVDGFGFSVGVDDDIIVVGAVNGNGLVSTSGSAYIFARNSGGVDNWGEVKKIYASDGEISGYFGNAVGISDGVVVIGAALSDATGVDSGAAYVFARNAGGADNWGEVKKLFSLDGMAGDEFGSSVSISVDTIVVGVASDDDGGSASGAVYIFERNQGGADNWGEFDKLTASDAISGGEFGSSVSAAKGIASVGARFGGEFTEGSGSAYVFRLRRPVLNIGLVGSGTVVSSPAGINCAGDCSEPYDAGTVVMLTATPDPGWTFGGWSGDADCLDGVVTMNTDTNCTASFSAPGVDLSVSKTESIDPVVAGSGPGNLIYVVTVTNAGSMAASGITLSELLTLPTGVAVDSITPSAGTFGGTTWTLGSLASGASETLSVVLTVSSTTVPGMDVICDTAMVTGVNETDVNPTNDSVTECTSVVPSISLDLAVTKSESVDPVIAGSGPGNLIYVVSVTNGGPGIASGVEVSEMLTLPTGVKIDSITPSAGTFAGTSWTLGSLASGGTETLTVMLTVSVSTPPGTDVICDTATVTGVNETDVNPANDSVTECTSVVASGVDLAVSKTESVDPVVAGSGSGNLVYIVTVFNGGTTTASGISLSELLTLPTGVTVDSITPSVGGFAGTTWTLGSLANGASETLTVVLTVSSSTAPGTDVICDTAAISGVNETDVNPANDSVTECTSVVASTVDLAVTKSESMDPVVAGSGPGNLTYVVTVSNDGSAAASGVELSEVLTVPAGVTVDFITPSAGTFAGTTWSLGSLASGASETLTVLLSVGSTTIPGADVICDTAAVTGVNELDVNPANDSATECTSVTASTVDLAVTKSESIDPVVAGSGPGNLTYVVTVTNSGPADASAVLLSELLTLPPGVTVDSITPSAGTFAGTTWTLGPLANGASETLTVVLTVGALTSPGSDVICSTATVIGVNEPDVNPANDSATECTSVVVTAVDLALTKSESIDPVVAGSGPGNLIYVVTVTNNGPSAASGVSISKALALPTGVTVDSITPSAGTFAGTTWTLGSLANGASETLTVVLTVSSSTVPGTDVICDTAAVLTVNEPDLDPLNDSVTECTSVVAGAVDLTMTQSESADPVIAGSGPGNLTYFVTVTNNGPADASGATLSNIVTIPSGVAVESILPSAGTFSGTTWILGSLLSGASEMLTVVLTVGSSAAEDTGSICNVATVIGVDQTDVNPANDSVTECTSVSREVDLAVTLSESSDPVAAGTLFHVVNVINNGPSDASGVELGEVLTLPPGVSIESVTPSTGTFSGTAWGLGDLDSGGGAMLNVEFSVDCFAVSGGSIISDAEVTSVAEMDTDPGNDSAIESTTVLPDWFMIGFDGMEADTVVNNQFPEATFSSDPGAEIRIVDIELGTTSPIICTWNDDVTCVNSVFIDFPVPVTCLTLQGIGVKATGQVASVRVFENGVPVATEPIVGNGDGETPVNIDLTAYRRISRIEFSASDEPEGLGFDDINGQLESSSTTLDLAVTQTESGDPVVAGSGSGNLTYVVTVTNGGPANASSVVLNEVMSLPIGVTVNSIVPSAGVFAGTTWTLGNLASDNSEILTIDLTVGSSTLPGTDVICSSAALTSVAEIDIDAANNSVTECTSVISPGGLIFSDGFESGDTSAWSSTQGLVNERNQ